jgi:hypothetical protein
VTHETIDATGCGQEIKSALYLVLDGTPYRDAARKVGFASHQDLHRAAKRLGLLEVLQPRARRRHNRLADLSKRRARGRARERTGNIPTKDLAGGQPHRCGQGGEVRRLGNQKHDPGATVGAIFDRLSQLEGKVQLEVTVEPPPTIDVTPSGSCP